MYSYVICIDELQQGVQSEHVLSSGGIHLTIVPQSRNPAASGTS